MDDPIQLALEFPQAIGFAPGVGTRLLEAPLGADDSRVELFHSFRLLPERDDPVLQSSGVIAGRLPIRSGWRCCRGIGCVPGSTAVSYGGIARFIHRRRSLMSSSKHFGYDRLRISEKAARTKNLQRALTEAAARGDSMDLVDRSALLGMITIVGELEFAIREITEHVFPGRAGG
ncbi:hypothetical protein RHRU231_930133 [Rhodococcus ruber]|uniref:Uncharacterized protein n=1 Tax=Rhodococcus ruber TaxID=1830 RepID=A0A098BU55_9NOCA|nr:hypothetical protein RHRU231_930133 [Rhodococcus ruber]